MAARHAAEAVREPIGTYREAVLGLLSRYRAYEWLGDDGDLPPEAAIVCDIFWVNEKTLRADLRKAWGAF